MQDGSSRFDFILFSDKDLERSGSSARIWTGAEGEAEPPSIAAFPRHERDDISNGPRFFAQHHNRRVVMSDSKNSINSEEIFPQSERLQALSPEEYELLWLV